jgi:hypothetical protein
LSIGLKSATIIISIIEFSPATIGPGPLDGVLSANHRDTQLNSIVNPLWDRHIWRRERHPAAILFPMENKFRPNPIYV